MMFGLTLALSLFVMTVMCQQCDEKGFCIGAALDLVNDLDKEGCIELCRLKNTNSIKLKI